MMTTRSRVQDPREDGTMSAEEAAEKFGYLLFSSPHDDPEKAMAKPMTIDDVLAVPDQLDSQDYFFLKDAIERFVAEQVAAAREIAHNAGFTEASRIHGAEIESYKQDAERYRYMRSNAEFLNRNGPGLYWYLPRWPRDGSESDKLDRSVDDAIRARAQEQQT